MKVQVEVLMLSNQPDGKGGWESEWAVHAIGGQFGGKYVHKGIFGKPPALRRFVRWDCGEAAQRWTDANEAASWARRMGFSVKSSKK